MADQLNNTPIANLLIAMTAAAQEAGRAALVYFRSGTETTAKVTMKAGDSPVTEADYAANSVLNTKLRSIWPDYGWISEEDVDSAERLSRNRLFVVDPIDGTRAFIAGKSEWCVSVGLIEAQYPIAGVIHLPVLGLTYAAAKGVGAFLNDKRLSCSNKMTLAGATFAGPKSMYERLQQQAGGDMHFAPRVPSLAYRLVQAASGKVDIAAASAGSHDWDIAAADIILSEAGAVLTDESGEQLIYNRASLRREVLLAGPSTLVKVAH